jgi:hypothetical protein
VLKIRAQWAGKRGTCPQCLKSVDFPVLRPVASHSVTTHQLLKLVAEDDESTLDNAQAERLSLLLSQGACIDYRMADQLLKDRPLSPRQWRRILNAADLREAMRIRFEAQAASDEAPTNGDDEPLSMQIAPDEVAPNAWKILARFLYYQRHGTCEACNANPTGTDCIYRTFEALLAARRIPEARAGNWQVILHRHLGI